jgi:putative hemolysin
MSGYWLDIGLVALLVLLNAGLAGSEMALVSLREGQLKQLERQGGRTATRLVRLARDPNRYLATIQIGITLAGFLASAAAAVSLAQPLVPHLGLLGAAAAPVAVGGVTVVLAFFTLVLGELAPKRLAMQRALPWAMAVAGPIDLLSRLSRPIVALLGLTSNAVVRLLGGRPESAPVDITSEELRDLVTTHKLLHAEQRGIISGALEIDRRLLREVLVPRRAVFTLDASLTISQALEDLADAGHSRAPVTRHHHLDHVVGIVHWSSVLRGGDEPVETVATPALYLPDSLRVTDALQRFKAERQQLAIVVDEYGDVDGIVTMEDLLEEIVGEIYDETDRDLAAVVRAPDGTVTLPGTFPLHDLEDLGVTIEHTSGDYTTLSGLVMARLGRVPERPGDVVEVDGWTIEVLAVAAHAVARVLLRPVESRPPHGPEAAGEL